MTDTDLLIRNLRSENEALRAELEQWIPCSEKLPEEWIDDDDNTYINYLIYMPYFNAADVGVYNADEECWLFRGVNGWGCDDDAWDEKLVDTVEKWSAAHPRKTRQSVFLEQWPETQTDIDGVLCVCPYLISSAYRGDKGRCSDPPKRCANCRYEFWGQEVE